MQSAPGGAGSTAVWLRGILLAGAFSSAALPPAFAAEANLSLVATAEPAPVVVGRELRFFLDLVNQGPHEAEDVTIEIDLPAEVSLVAASPSQGACEPGPPLLCRLGQVTAAYPANRASIAVETVADLVMGISFVATAVSSTADPFPDDNSATAWLSSVALSDSADVGVASRSLPTPAFAGWQDPEFVIQVANTGPAAAGVVEVQVGIQELRMASFVSASSSQGGCSTALDTCVGFQCLAVLNQSLSVFCDLGGLPAGATASVHVSAAIDLEAGEHLTVSARAAARDMADADPSNNSMAVAVPVYPVPGAGVQGGAGPGGCFIHSVPR
ncbi:MAG: DUF11 domain-containing protein [Deferrisomatales bacterium]|nr:DUF11 domain-containing protein [Deferrisomatales bacterium]